MRRDCLGVSMCVCGADEVLIVVHRAGDLRLTIFEYLAFRSVRFLLSLFLGDSREKMHAPECAAG